ncbi:MAG: hypothetical protein M3Q05_14885, partial [Bacteroidota bacterium]|nr:hypothetical protein [Bacteroidota bacterium]
LIYATDLRSTAQDMVDARITEPASLQKNTHVVWLWHWRFFTNNGKMRLPRIKIAPGGDR